MTKSAKQIPTNNHKRRKERTNCYKVLIHDERADIPEFLFKAILSHGYKAGFAKDFNDIIVMLSSDSYEVVLTNGGYKELNPAQRGQLKSLPIFIIDIKDSRSRDQDMGLKADLYLQKPMLISELWNAIENHSNFFRECVVEKIENLLRR